MKENYLKLAENTENLFELRDQIQVEERKSMYCEGISMRENGVNYSMNQIKELMQKISNNNIKKVSTLDELFENFNNEFHIHNEAIIKMKVEFQLLLSEKKVIVKEIVENTPNNPNTNFLKLSEFSKSNKAIEAFQNLAKQHPDQVGFKSMQILDNDLSSNNVRILIEGNLDTIKDLIRSSKDSKVKYIKTIANDKINDHFYIPETFNNVFLNSKVTDLNSFDKEDFDVTFKNSNKQKNR